MGDRLDVAERLAEGRLAVEHTQTYVRACQALGYEESDLTSNPSQIRDGYGTEDGLNLHALDRDCAELRAAGDAVTEGLRMQRAQLGELAAAWTGPGGDAALAFLQRHCDEAATLATEVRAAAQRCESLRDNLWCLVDAKVATAVAIDDRTAAQRPTWLAAAASLTTGAGDRWTAAEIVREQVKPYVDNDIRNEWVSSMRSSLAGVAASYDMVTDRMAATPVVYFELPGDLGPGWQPVAPVPPGAPALPAPPAAAVVTPAAAAPPAVAPAAAAPPAAPAAAPPTDLAPLPDLGTSLGGASGMPSGAGDLGGLSGLGGLGGLASRIVGAMGGLLGSAGDAHGGEDPFDEDAFGEDPFHPDDERDDSDDRTDDDAEESEPPEKGDKAAGDKPVDAAFEAPPPVGAPPVEAPPPADTLPPAEAPPGEPPPAAAPAPAAGPPTDGSTPCQIAADQLPQAGQ
ncbi:hypothetical protein [Mycobacterium sp. IS-1264]|uniref:hypothetical protein n=1 Tax=Mycobacterium sp. IS-1264 TaxID=1834158 RepID=UPI00096FD69E|nr:hypothetical protein [Mycobacterium sp. IS-1264]OMC43558.1 hypothetical protein A5744_00880 [Mycobacterium sp. IS-1264]